MPPRLAKKSIPGKRSPARRRGRPRSRALDEQILGTTLELLAEVGYEHFTVREVLSRTGVSSATLYRRWPTQRDLIIAAIQTTTAEPKDIDTGSLASDLSEFLRMLGTGLSRREELPRAGRAKNESDPEFVALIEKTLIEPRRRVLERILAHAHERGELGTPPPIDECWSWIVGPLHHHIFVRNAKFDSASLEAGATFATAGLLALCPPARETPRGTGRQRKKKERSHG